MWKHNTPSSGCISAFFIRKGASNNASESRNVWKQIKIFNPPTKVTHQFISFPEQRTKLHPPCVHSHWLSNRVKGWRTRRRNCLNLNQIERIAYILFLGFIFFYILARPVSSIMGTSGGWFRLDFWACMGRRNWKPVKCERLVATNSVRLRKGEGKRKLYTVVLGMWIAAAGMRALGIHLKTHAVFWKAHKSDFRMRPLTKEDSKPIRRRTSPTSSSTVCTATCGFRFEGDHVKSSTHEWWTLLIRRHGRLYRLKNTAYILSLENLRLVAQRKYLVF